MKYRKLSPVAFCFATVLLASLDLPAQNDPGPRPGSASAGSFFPTLNSDEQALFDQASQVLREIDSVSGTVAGEPGSGLGPTFNGNSCTQCHAQPAPGGSSPGLNSPQNSIPNPQIALATLDSATNTIPSLVTANGPMLEARFVKNPDGTPDGGVHDLYTIQGRSDAPGCTLAQPDFATAVAQGNVIFRIPTPLFGLGLVEATSDQALIDNLNATATSRATLGIEVPSTPVETTAASRVSGGKRRTNLSSSSRERLTTSKWVSRMNCFPTSGARPQAVFSIAVPKIQLT